MVNDIQREETMEFSSKTMKEHKSFKRPNIQLRYSDDETRMNKYLLKSDNAVMGLFCRDGCNFCQKAKNEIIRLGEILEFSAIHIVIVDINNPYLPDNMAVPWTPFIRYKSHGASSTWVDYTESDYKLLSIIKFLHKSMTSTESVSSNPTELQGENKQSTRRRKRSIFTGKPKLLTTLSNLLTKASVCLFKEKSRHDCFGNVMLLKPKGRLVKKKWDLSESIEQIGYDYNEILKRLQCYLDAGVNNCISPAVIAAIASRETRAGKLLYKTYGWGDMQKDGSYKAYGIMQCDTRFHNTCLDHEWGSCDHINALVRDVLVEYIKDVRVKHSKWPNERQLQGGVAAYNFGVKNVQNWATLDKGSTNDDYSNDVIARAQWLISKNASVWNPR